MLLLRSLRALFDLLGIVVVGKASALRSRRTLVVVGKEPALGSRGTLANLIGFVTGPLLATAAALGTVLILFEPAADTRGRRE